MGLNLRVRAPEGVQNKQKRLQTALVDDSARVFLCSHLFPNIKNAVPTVAEFVTGLQKR